MAKKIGTRTVSVVRSAKVDRLSSGPAPAATTHDIEGCAVLPRSSNEAGRGWVVVEGRTIFAPYGSDVTADDQIDVDGKRWDIDGEPGHFENRRGVGKVTIFYLKRLGT